MCEWKFATDVLLLCFITVNYLQRLVACTQLIIVCLQQCTISLTSGLSCNMKVLVCVQRKSLCGSNYFSLLCFLVLLLSLLIASFLCILLPPSSATSSTPFSTSVLPLECDNYKLQLDAWEGQLPLTLVRDPQDLTEGLMKLVLPVLRPFRDVHGNAACCYSTSTIHHYHSPLPLISTIRHCLQGLGDDTTPSLPSVHHVICYLFLCTIP